MYILAFHVAINFYDEELQKTIRTETDVNPGAPYV